MQEVEFSFFTLPDSGAFLTHAPRRLSEALALVYPFQREVWPALIFTILVTGPILYLMIVIPETLLERKKRRVRWMKRMLRTTTTSYCNIVYIKEITRQRTRGDNIRPIPINRSETAAAAAVVGVRGKERQLKRDGLFAQCVWFTCHIFLRQCSFQHSFFSFLISISPHAT